MSRSVQAWGSINKSSGAEAIVQHAWLANDKASVISRSPHDAPGVIPEFRARSNLWASLGVAQKQKKGSILSVTLSFHTGRGQRCHNLVLSPESFSLVLDPWGRYSGVEGTLTEVSGSKVS